MKKLLNKECRLTANPLSFIFIAAAFFTLIPRYPILVGSFFVCLGIFYSFQNARESGDIYYSVLLPVKKTDIVRAKYAFTVMIQMISFVLMCILTVLRMTVLERAQAYADNPLMNATPVYLAFVLLVFALFNTVFLAWHFRTAWKIGVAFIAFCAVSFILIGAAEALHHIPGLSFLNETGKEALPLQLAVLGAAALIYAVSTAVSCRASEKRFMKIDL
jgi:hypothetical protein